MSDATLQPDLVPTSNGSTAPQESGTAATADSAAGGTAVPDAVPPALDPVAEIATATILAAAPEQPPSADDLSLSSPLPQRREELLDPELLAAIDAARQQHPPLHAMPSSRGFMSTLLGTLVFFISLAAIVTVALYVVEPPAAAAEWANRKHIIAPLAGTLVGIVTAIIFALVNREYTQPDRVDPRVYGEFRERLAALDAALPVICPAGGPRFCDYPSLLACRAGCDEAWARRDFINAELQSRGARWALGSGYIDLWRQLHAAEEALFVVLPFADVIGNGLFDELRLKGANKIPNRAMLESQLQRVLAALGAPSAALQPAADTTITPALHGKEVSAQESALGRVVLRDVRRAINQYRDGERANLVRARNQLAWTGTITAVAGYTLLVLAVATQAPPAAVVGGVAYYLVGATVGLFNQLRVDSGVGEGQEDFGFNRARLFFTPVLSGLAAVGGVLIVALLGEAINFGPIAGSGLEIANASGTFETTNGGPILENATVQLQTRESVPLSDIFELQTFGIGLLVAAVFGLTPDLLIDRLQHKANEYRTRLAASTAAAGEVAGTTSP
jgi:hypothetical protein